MTTEEIDIYERLADAIDALPHGFARTESGVELKLIKMAFTEEEVSLAGHLTRHPETAAEIAARVGRDEAEVTALLESLVPRGLVSLNSPRGRQGAAFSNKMWRAKRNTDCARSWWAGTRPACDASTRSSPNSSSSS